jgi:hypothetical protein
LYHFVRSPTYATTSLAEHDFFTAQPIKNASIFLMKQILHDWSSEWCLKILKQLRASAQTDTKLILLESIVPLACHDPANDDGEKEGVFKVEGAKITEAPAPLLPNYGVMNSMIYSIDVIVSTPFLLSFRLLSRFVSHPTLTSQMAALCNSQERTLIQWDDLLTSGGWKISEIRKNTSGSGLFYTIVALPI